MSANCGVCGVVCSDEKLSIKCSGECERVFHLKCIKADGVKTRTSNKDWKCDDCQPKKESSVMSSKSSTSSTAVTKQFMINVLDAFKKEVFDELKQHNDKLNDFNKTMEFLSKGIDDANVLMNNIRKEFKDIKKQNEELVLKNAELTGAVDKLTDRVRELEQYSRKANVEISGIPSTPKEDSLSLVKDIGKAIGQPVDQDHVLAVHRVPSYNTKRDPPLIVQFRDRLVRDKWLSTFKSKKTLMANEVHPTFPKNRVYINEHLCPENKQFLGKLKMKCRELGIRYVWFREGKFFVRKSDGEQCHKIVKIQDLNKIF